MKTCPRLLGAVLLALSPLAPLRSAAQAPLFSDDFDTDTAANWTVFNGSGNGTPDFSAEFSYDYSKDKLPPAPNSVGKTTRGVKLNVNKNDNVANIAGVSIYPKGKTFSGNYALRFDMWMGYNGPAFGGTGSTEYGTFGLNHKGDKVNWASATDSDGVWFAVAGEAGATRDYQSWEALTGFAPSELRGVDGGFLDRDGDGSPEFESNRTQSADVPLKTIFPSPPFGTPGAPGKQWVQVEVRQKDGVLTWLLNGYVMAARPNTSEFTSGNVMLGYMDTFNSIASPKEENFIVYDNVRVVNLDTEPAIPEVSVEATDAEAAEPGTNTGTFTISRTGPTTAALEVSFALAGTAGNGADYATNALSAVIPAGAKSATVSIKPVDDPQGEPTETVSLVLTASPYRYDVGAAFRATVNLLDDGDVASVSIRAADAHAYERLAEDTGSFAISRLGDAAPELRVNVSVGGTAASAKDFTGAVGSVVIPAGETNVVVVVAPVDDTEVEGDETVVFSIAAGPNYVIGASSEAVVTIRDNDSATAMVLFSDNFDSDSASRWTVRFGAVNGILDYAADFAYDYGAASIPSAPNAAGGSTKGLRLTVNKADATASAASVNAYPNGQTFQGNFALRFDMFLTYGTDVGGTTEHAIFGLNHSGSRTNRHATAGSDGLWFAVETDGSASGGGRSYVSYVSTNATAAPPFVTKSARDFDSIFTKPPYLVAGAPSGQWADVEVAQTGNEITWKINGAVILQRTNTSEFTAGNIMLGFMDTFNSIGSQNNYVVFDNVRVVSLGAAAPGIKISGIQPLADGRVQINFSATSGGAAQFSLLGAASVLGPYTPETDAVIQAGASAGQFQATAPRPASAVKFYRLKL